MQYTLGLFFFFAEYSFKIIPFFYTLLFLQFNFCFVCLIFMQFYQMKMKEKGTNLEIKIKNNS